MHGTSRLAHLGISGPFSSHGAISSHSKLIKLIFFLHELLIFLFFKVDSNTMMDKNTRISPDNNLDFYPYSQQTSYSVISNIYLFKYFIFF